MPNNPVVASYVADFLKIDQLHVYRQLTGLSQEFDMHVFTHHRENEAYFPYHEKWLHVLPKPQLRWWRRFIHKQIKQEPWQMFRWELRRWLLDLTRVDAQVLHIYFGHVAPQFIPLMKAWLHPVVVSYHGADAGVDMDKPRYRAAMQEVFRLATQVQSRSMALSEDLVKLGCPPEKIVLQRTGVPFDRWPFKPRTAPEDGAWHLLQSCRFIEKKGLDLTLQAFAEVVKHYPKARLTLAGSGPLREALQQQAEALGVAGSVAFPGFLHEGRLAPVVYDAHVCLHPSRTGKDGNREGVPNAMLEAMASGLPVVATNHGGIPEAITHGVSGLLVEENDAPALAQAVLRLTQDASLRSSIAQAGREAVEESFAREKQDARLAANYKELMTAAASRR